MFIKILKKLGWLLLAVLLIGGVFAAHEWNAKKPFMFRVFLDRTLVKMAFDSPETLTSLGFLEGIGIKGHNAELNDDRPEKGDEMFDKILEVKETMLTYKDEDLDESQKISKEIAMYLLDFAADSKEFRYYNYPVKSAVWCSKWLPKFYGSAASS